MEIKKWLESVLLPTVQDVKFELLAVKKDVESLRREITSDTTLLRKDLAHLEKEMLLRFDHVNMRLNHLETHITDGPRQERRFGAVKNA
ncbi:hypothetical protein C4580_05290 [Candidatus Woesearchaeota archaeon]|nr:MAG: hypothetical protein C4580_05290 [Candidatus Woesearchaeota archaeon]